MISVNRRHGGVAAVVVVVILGAWVGSAAASSAGAVVKGTVVGGLPVGGVEAAELMSFLAPAARAVERRPLTLVVGEREWVRSPEALGIGVDLDSSARRALGSGRDSTLSWVARSVGGVRRSLDWVPAVDRERFERALADLAELVEVEPSNGDFGVNGSVVTVTPPSDGYALLQGATREALVRAAMRPAGGDRVALPVEVSPPEITSDQLDRVKEQAESILRAPVDFVYEGRAFQVAPEHIAPSLGVKMVDGPNGSQERILVLGADPEVLKQRIVSVAPFVERDPRDASFTVSGGRVVLHPSQDGSTIDTGAAAIALAELGTGERRPIPLPVAVQPPALNTDAASKLGIRERIASFTTPFDSRNSPRVGNIDRMASAIDGTVLKPGELFSLNGTTGARTVANGYQEAGILVDGEVVPGIGGGVCQVATTLFNAVFSAGLEVTERANHSLFISSYPTGKDAMVNYGVQDLKFRNDTSYGMLLTARVSSQELTVSIYSSPLGRTVSESITPRTNHREPEVRHVEDPALPTGSEVVSAEGIPGFDVTVTRRVTEGARVLHSDNFVSRYRPWKRIIKQGTGPPEAQAPREGPAPAEGSTDPAPAEEPEGEEFAPSPSPSESPDGDGD